MRAPAGGARDRSESSDPILDAQARQRAAEAAAMRQAKFDSINSSGKAGPKAKAKESVAKGDVTGAQLAQRINDIIN